MKIAIIGSTSYLEKMKKHRDRMAVRGHEVFLPALDDKPELNELGICAYNLENIYQADRVDIFWDCRSMGTIFDFGMAFALGKRIKIIFLEPKTFMNVMKQYEAVNPPEEG